MNEELKQAIDQIDAAFFSEDTPFNDLEMKKYLEDKMRWWKMKLGNIDADLLGDDLGDDREDDIDEDDEISAGYAQLHNESLCRNRYKNYRNPFR